MNDMDTLPLEMPEPPKPATLTGQCAVAQVRPIPILEMVSDIQGNLAQVPRVP